jgi:hypothetical protein
MDDDKNNESESDIPAGNTALFTANTSAGARKRYQQLIVEIQGSR